jgi:hypothetical protein
VSARLAGAALLLGVLLFVLLRVLTGALGPLPGAGLSLLAYGAALLALLRAAGAPLAEGLEARSPGRLVLLALAAPVVVVGAMASLALGAASLPPQVILSAGLLAMALAVLEERFWRAALVPRPHARRPRRGPRALLGLSRGLARGGGAPDGASRRRSWCWGRWRWAGPGRPRGSRAAR